MKKGCGPVRLKGPHRAAKGGERMEGYAKNIGHTGSQVIEAVTPKKGGVSPDVSKGGDLRGR